MSEAPLAGHDPSQRPHPLGNPLELAQGGHQPPVGQPIDAEVVNVGPSFNPREYPLGMPPVEEAEVMDDSGLNQRGRALGMPAAEAPPTPESNGDPNLAHIAEGLQTLGAGMQFLTAGMVQIGRRLGVNLTRGADPEEEGPEPLPYVPDYSGKKPYGWHGVFERNPDGTVREAYQRDSNGDLILVVDPATGGFKRYPVKARALGITDRPEALNPDDKRRPPMPLAAVKGVPRVATRREEATQDDYSHHHHSPRAVRAAKWLAGRPGWAADIVTGLFDLGGDRHNRLLTEADVAQMNAATRAANTPVRDPVAKPVMNKTGHHQRGASFVSQNVNGH